MRLLCRVMVVRVVKTVKASSVVTVSVVAEQTAVAAVVVTPPSLVQRSPLVAQSWTVQAEQRVVGEIGTKTSTELLKTRTTLLANASRTLSITQNQLWYTSIGDDVRLGNALCFDGCEQPNDHQDLGQATDQD